jgi:hypothetical protein
MDYTTIVNPLKTLNVQFDVYDEKNRQLGVEIKTYTHQKIANDFTVNLTEIDTTIYFVASIHQTRNNQTFGGSYARAYYKTVAEMQQWIDAKVTSVQKSYAKKFAETAVA